MADQRFGVFLTNLGIKNPTRKNVGYNYAPFTVQQGQSTPGQSISEKVDNRVTAGESIYQANRQKVTNRVASDVAGKSAFNIPTDEFGLVSQELSDFRPMYTRQVQSTGQRGRNALLAAEARNTWQQAKAMQDLGQYGFTGPVEVGNGTTIPGAKSGNPGARVAEMAMQMDKGNTPYVYGGNSLNKGVDCSSLVQLLYRQLGVNVPRTTWEQAKHGKVVSVGTIRPGDLVFYRNTGHVGIYVGNGKIVHAANSKLGIITSGLVNSNGSPELVVRPY